jgi:signal transduction histidine kinase
MMIGAIGEEPTDGFAAVGGARRNFTVERPLVRNSLKHALLFDVAANHALGRRAEGRFRFLRATDVLDIDEATSLGLSQGLIAEIRTGTQQGWLVLWGMPELSADYVGFGRELGRAAGAILARHALLAAIETSAAARTRLSLARDVHDSIVQFLAGAAIRLEAIKRAGRAGAAVEPELDELKRLFVEEQGELRGLVAALRSDGAVELREVASELRALAERLSQQWSVECRVKSSSESAAIPIRLQLDLSQLLREAVANAVRHGHARHVDVDLAVDEGRLHLTVADDGAGFPQTNGEPAMEPRSLSERVERANGSLRLISSAGSTNIFISLPLAGAVA